MLGAFAPRRNANRAPPHDAPQIKHTLGCAPARPKGALVSRRHSVSKSRNAREQGETPCAPLAAVSFRARLPRQRLPARRALSARKPVARAHHPRRDAGRPALARSDLDHREHHRLSRRDDLRHAVRARRRDASAAADGRQVGPLRRQAHLYVRAARRAEVLRRRRRHGRRRGRVDPPLGRARRRRPAHDGAREGPFEEGRQDLHDRPEGALRPDARGHGEDRDTDPLHHAQEGSRDRSEPADHRIHRLRAVHLQSRRDADGLALRLRPQSELRLALRAFDRHGGREERQGRSRDLREHAGLADRAAGA